MTSTNGFFISIIFNYRIALSAPQSRRELLAFIFFLYFFLGGSGRPDKIDRAKTDFLPKPECHSLVLLLPCHRSTLGRASKLARCQSDSNAYTIRRRVRLWKGRRRRAHLSLSTHGPSYAHSRQPPCSRAVQVAGAAQSWRGGRQATQTILSTAGGEGAGRLALR